MSVMTDARLGPIEDRPLTVDDLARTPCCDQILTAYQLSGDCYEPVAIVSGEDTFRTDMPFPFSVVPALLVADNARWTAALPRG